MKAIISNDILYHIFNFLEAPDVLKAFMLNKYYNNALQQYQYDTSFDIFGDIYKRKNYIKYTKIKKIINKEAIEKFT